jgi:hypothetical protein
MRGAFTGQLIAVSDTVRMAVSYPRLSAFICGRYRVLIFALAGENRIWPQMNADKRG